MTYPIYILDLDGEDMVVFPEGKLDVTHTDFWVQTVAPILSQQFSVPLKPLLNIPYCQRRARISSSMGLVFYGEKQTQKLLKKITKATGETDLQWAFDEHECRLSFDVTEFQQRTQQ